MVLLLLVVCLPRTYLKRVFCFFSFKYWKGERCVQNKLLLFSLSIQESKQFIVNTQMTRFLFCGFFFKDV